MTDGQNQAQSSPQPQDQERKQHEQERMQRDNKSLSTEDMAHPAQKAETGAMGPATRISPGAPEPTRTTTTTPSIAPTTARPTPLLKQEEIQAMRNRWINVQSVFVDEPRHSVEQADTLVAELMQQLAQTFAAEKNKLEGQWERGQQVSTEDLRLALQHYRSFFDRLLSF